MTRPAFASSAVSTAHAGFLVLVALYAIHAEGAAGLVDKTLQELPDCTSRQSGMEIPGHAEAAHQCMQTLASQPGNAESAANMATQGNADGRAATYCGAACDAALGAADCRDCIRAAAHLKDLYCAVDAVNATIVLGSCAVASSAADLNHVADSIDGVRGRLTLAQIANANGRGKNDLDADDGEANGDGERNNDVLDEEEDGAEGNIDGGAAGVHPREHAAGNANNVKAAAIVGGRKGLGNLNWDFHQANDAANFRRAGADAGVAEGNANDDYADARAKSLGQADVVAKLKRKDILVDANLYFAEAGANRVQKMEGANADDTKATTNFNIERSKSDANANTDGANAAENANLADSADTEMDLDGANANTAISDETNSDLKLQDAITDASLNDLNADDNLDMANGDGAKSNDVLDGATVAGWGNDAELHDANENMNDADLSDANENTNDNAMNGALNNGFAKSNANI